MKINFVNRVRIFQLPCCHIITSFTSLHSLNPVFSVYDPRRIFNRFISVSKALVQARHLLENERHVSTTTASTSIGLVGDAPNLYEHTYVDKYTLCECMTNTMIASIMNLLTLQPGDGSPTSDGSMGSSAAVVPIFDIQAHQLKQILSWVHQTEPSSSSHPEATKNDDTVKIEPPKVAPSSNKKRQTLTLRFIAEDTCTLLKEEETQLISHDDKEFVTTTTTATSKNSNSILPVFGGGKQQQEETTTSSTKVIHRIKEYHWKVGLRYKIILFPGTSLDQKIVLHERVTQSTVITQGGSTTGTPLSNNSHKFRPIPERTVHPPIDTYCLTHLFRLIDPIHQSSTFTIDRDTVLSNDTKTPCRNRNMEQMIVCLHQLQEWMTITQGFFLQRVEREIVSRHNPVHPHKTPTTFNIASSNTNILDPGTIGIMQGLTKEPSFNGKQIRIVEYYPETQRYKAEPFNLNEGLPNTLSIKRNNIAVPSEQDEKDAIMMHPNYMPPSLQNVSDEIIFCPILPVMDSGNVLSMNEIGFLLQEHSRTLELCLHNVSQVYPSKQLFKLISISEASIVLACKHINRIVEQYFNSVQYIEDLLQQQLVTAIGKNIDPNDFQSYMKYHYSRFYSSQYSPIPFSHPIRRPQHYPDGIISIEAIQRTTSTLDSSSNSSTTPSTTNVPIETWVRSIPGGNGIGNDSITPSIFMPIDAAISIELTGDRFLHGWMQHQFYSASTKYTKISKPPSLSGPIAEPVSTEYRLACSARQFSSFILVLGTMAGPNKFEPKEAIIVQNKDEVLIPLTTTILPSAKEFKDAIQSLSPEQQQFAKAYRTMQLESSVFGICVIQIKPQLERLLGLPDHALTKEIQLTQDIMSLFVDYQVPSDLMTYDGPPESTINEKINVVRCHVAAILKVIDESKSKQLKEEVMRADMRAEMSYSGPTVPLSMPGSGFGAVESVASTDTGLDPSTRSGVGGSFRRRRLQKPSHQPETSTLAMRGIAPQAMTQLNTRENTIPNNFPVPKTKKIMKKVTQEDSMVPSSNLPGLEKQKPVSGHDVSTTILSNKVDDFTLIPKVLDTKLEQYDTDHSLHSIILKSGDDWTRTRQMNFLTSPETTCLRCDDIRNEKIKAYALLDALSRSGTLPIANSELHVFVAVSHCFENDVMGTVIQDNINPIMKVERSSLLLASTIYGIPIPTLIEHDHDLHRIAEAFPSLMISDGSSSGQTTAPSNMNL